MSGKKMFPKVNGQEGPELVKPIGENTWSTKGGDISSILRTGPQQYSVVLNGRSHRITQLVSEGNAFRFRIQGKTYTVELQDDQERKLQELGLEKAVHRVVRELRAPMPGLVLKILVEEGQTVKKGDGILVLEAMKMENLIKSPSDAILEKVHINQGDAVEKNQLLMNFK